jgi:hypothetical protein
MSNKKLMENFFASFLNQTTNPTSGRIVNTAMGPFRYNAVTQMWQNVNNGMMMNNVSFQDQFFMMDYSTTAGDKLTAQSSTPIVISYRVLSGWTTVTSNSFGINRPRRTWWLRSSGGATLTYLTGASGAFGGSFAPATSFGPTFAVTLSNNLPGGNVTVTLSLNHVSGTGPSGLEYVIGSNQIQQYTSPFTITNNEPLKIGVVYPLGNTGGGTGAVNIFGTTTPGLGNSYLGSITYASNIVGDLFPGLSAYPVGVWTNIGDMSPVPDGNSNYYYHTGTNTITTNSALAYGLTFGLFNTPVEIALCCYLISAGPNVGAGYTFNYRYSINNGAYIDYKPDFPPNINSVITLNPNDVLRFAVNIPTAHAPGFALNNKLMLYAWNVDRYISAGTSTPPNALSTPDINISTDV